MEGGVLISLRLFITAGVTSTKVSREPVPKTATFLRLI